jgi:hypothetical protein
MELVERIPVTRKLLQIAGGAGVGVFVSIVLHNVFYALGVWAADYKWVGMLMNALSAVSFMAALVIFPVVAIIALVLALLRPVLHRTHGASRFVVLIVLPVVAVVGGLYALHNAVSMSRTRSDPEAGFNGSFEVMRSGYPANWSVYHKPLDDEVAVLSADTGAAMDGRQSLRFTVADPLQYRGWRTPGLFQQVPAEPGVTYSVTLWVNAPQGKHHVAIGCFEEGVSKHERISRDVGPTAAWEQFTYALTIPEGGSSLRFEFGALGPGDIWLDDVRIEAVPPQ